MLHAFSWCIYKYFLILKIKCNIFVFRHVMLPKEIAKLVPKNHLMSESEWRSIGVQQSQGWKHYMVHEPGTKYY